jgi:hypothetical protein
MTYLSSDLNSKTEKDLQKILTELDVEFDENKATKSDLIFSILDAQAIQHTELMEEIETAPIAKPTKAKRFQIILSNQEGVEQTPFVKVQVNGEMFAIPREVEVSVPDYVIEVLEHAIVTRYAQVGDEMIEQKSRRFPFQILGESK